MKSFQVKIKGEVLTWARQSLNISVEEAAAQLKLQPQVILALESETEQPTISLLQKMSGLYKRSLAVFLLPAAPKEPGLPKDFRILPDAAKKLSPKARLAIRRSQRVQSLAFELNGDYEYKIFFNKQIDLSEDTESIASNFRKKIGIDVEQQFGWNNPSDAFKNWRSALENLNILVLQDSMPVNEIRGFSLREKTPFIMVVNSKDSPNGRNFTLFHEYCHLLLAQSGICDLRERSNVSVEQRVETFCNRFSGAFLVPGNSIKNQSFVNNTYREKWEDSTLEFLADEYKVSREVILRRLVILNLASEDFYKQKREEWSKIERKSYGRTTQAKKSINQNGVAFTTLVINSFNEGKITFRDVSDYLNVKPKHVNTIEQLLGY